MLSPLLLVLTIILLNYVLRKCTDGYKLYKSQEKINHLMYLDNIKLFARKRKKRIGNLNTGNEDIQSEYRDRIWHRKMRHASNEKREMTHDGANRTTKSRKSQNTQ